ncbi:MAG: RidA family protein [Chryseolinea sp.]
MSILKIEHINPQELIKNPAFTNVITVSGPAKTIYIGEQNSNNAHGQVIGKGSIKEQTSQVLENIKKALAAVGGEPTDVIKWTIYVVQGQNLHEGFESFKKSWIQNPKPPVITMVYVNSLSNPDYLIGMEAIAVIADK